MTCAADHLVGIFAQSSGELVRELTTYELARLAQFDQPRSMWLLVGGGLGLLGAIAVGLYTRERRALRGPRRALLTGLRLTALVALAIYFLQPEKRTDQQVVTDSQVVVLVDTSQSMSVQDEPMERDAPGARSAAVQQALRDSPLLATLRQQHQVVLATFDEKLRRVQRWPRGTDRAEDAQDAEAAQESAQESTASAWNASLAPQGAETRLGNALRAVLEEPLGGPLAGVIVLTDGGQNSGIDPLEVADVARARQVPVYTVGLGSTAPRRNVRVQEIQAPTRAYPGDRASLRCQIQGEGVAGQRVAVELYAREAGATTGSRLERQTITFGAAAGNAVDEDSDKSTEGETITLEFPFEPTEAGRLALEIRIEAPAGDSYAPDNRREVEVEVVESESRVLLMASGASRDYRFLRNQLRRDSHLQVDVWLQLSAPGVSQDADQILEAFPTSKEALYAYDTIVAFDPDWQQLDAVQVDLLESWVGEEAGGLIVVAGPIHTSSWLQSPEQGPIRALYPVTFQRRLTALDDGVYGSTTPWPLEFTEEGLASDFLWLGDTAAASRALWAEFPGVFGCYAVKGPKPGARVLARYSDPNAGLTLERPVYLAEHFYGAGRVLYLGSSELWRLRSLGVELFEKLTTQLIRHVSQGRLLRGSSRGHLLVERDRYTVGDDVVVRAQLSALNREPWVAPRVTARVVDPSGQGRNLVMRADANRPGNFIGQFSVRLAGAYRLELPVPEVPDEQLVRQVQVIAPNLEFDKTRRGEPLLAALAKRSGGLYYASLTSAVAGNKNLQPVAARIESRAETNLLRGTPDRAFTKRIHRILLGVLCGALCLEWLLRRLARLA